MSDTHGRFGRIVLEDRVEVGRVRFGATIDAIEPVPSKEGDDLPWIVPGFIDVHVHGGGGGDVMEGPDGVRTMARTHLAHGTTTLCPTTLTAAWDEVLAALDAIATVAAEDEDAQDGPEPSDLPSIAGTHLEGPFVSPARLGAQPDAAQRPDAAKIDRLLAGGSVSVVTMAPEIDGAIVAATRLAASGVRVSAGHTRADAATAEAFYDAIAAEGGVSAATHLFNAMGGIEARAPGVAGIALARSEPYVELICDGIHLAPAVVLLALRTKPDRTVLISDAVAAAGTDEMRSHVGGREVRISGGAVRLPDGTLAGSTLTMDRALRTLLGFGVPMVDAVRAASTTPARYLGLGDRGAVRPGLRADLVVLSADGEVREVIRGGRTVAGRAPEA